MRAAVVASALALTAVPALAGSIFDYGHMADAKVILNGRTFEITVHGKRDTMMLQPTMGGAWSLSDPPGKWPLPVWRKAAEAFVSPAGCGISDIVALGIKTAGTWEATFVCPAGIDLHELVAEQRVELRRGQPLHP